MSEGPFVSLLSYDLTNLLGLNASCRSSENERKTRITLYVSCKVSEKRPFPTMNANGHCEQKQRHYESHWQYRGAGISGAQCVDIYSFTKAKKKASTTLTPSYYPGQEDQRTT